MHHLSLVSRKKNTGMDMKARVGIRIKTLRQNRNLSQADLAADIERSVDAISAIERGKSLPNFETLERLANSLQVPVREFFDEDDDSTSPRRSALYADINDMLRDMPDGDLETVAGLVRTIARRK